MYPYLAPANLVMVYLLGATIAALRLGRGPASLTVVVNVVVFDFFFVSPRFSLAIADFQYVITLAVMLGVALIIANLVASVRAQTRVAGARERRTTLLYGMTRELMRARSVEDLALVAVKHISEAFDARAVLLLPDSTQRLRHPRYAGCSGRGAQ
jgi:two-component system sensor histidine kinase KdpD